MLPLPPAPGVAGPGRPGCGCDSDSEGTGARVGHSAGVLGAVITRFVSDIEQLLRV